jgi:hypothetical protein
MSSSSGDGAGAGGSPGPDLPAWGTGEPWPSPHVPPDPPAVPFPEAAPSEPASRRDWRRKPPAALIGVAVIAVVAVAAALLLWRTNDSGPAAESLSVEPAPAPVEHSATDCTNSVTSGEVPPGDLSMVSAGGLSFPRSVAPDWRAKAEHRVPNSIDAVSLDEKISDMGDRGWIGQLTVGITNFDPSMSLADQARLLLKCVLRSDLYADTSAVAGEGVPTAGRLDGTPTSTIEVPVSVRVPDPTILGDDVVVIIVGTRPSTYFLATTPFGDVERAAVVRAAREQLHISAV